MKIQLVIEEEALCIATRCVSSMRLMLLTKVDLLDEPTPLAKDHTIVEHPMFGMSCIPRTLSSIHHYASKMSASTSPARNHSPPPAALGFQKRRHGRSSSFTDFMSKLLPASRTARTHTLRSNFQAGGDFDATDLVFGITNDSTDIAAVLQQRADTGLGGNDKQESRNIGRSRRDTMDDSVSTMGVRSRSKSILTTTAQQMFEDRKSLREERRALRRSGDYLGVQGANPRTGYADPSASSTETSQMSEGTRRRLEREAHDLEERRRKFEEAHVKHRMNLEVAQRAKDAKRREKAERKKIEEGMRQRRLGRWRPDGNGWSSVAEPHLSPIVQS